MKDTQKDIAALMGQFLHPMLPEQAGVEPVLKMLSGIKCVLFDVYGTMLTCGHGEIGIDGAGSAGSAAFDSLIDLGLEVRSGSGPAIDTMLAAEISADHDRSRVAGIEYPEVDIVEIWGRVISRALAADLVSGAALDRPAIRELAVRYECVTNPAWPMPGLARIIDTLSAAGVVLGVFSNAQFYTPILLGVFEDTRWNTGKFDKSVCAWSYLLREAKPSARLIGHSLERLKADYGIKAGEVLCIGNDLLNDVTSSGLAGCRTALFAGDRRSLRMREGDGRCSGVRPDLVITSFDQLAECLPAR